MMYENELYHYGIKRRSGRYPWGSGERPYQGDNISASKRKSSAKKALTKSVSKEEYEEAKQKAIKSGKASEVAKFKDDLSNKEFNDALNRIQMEEKLSSYSEKEAYKGYYAIDRAMSKVGRVVGWTATGTAAVALAKKAYNHLGVSSKPHYINLI